MYALNMPHTPLCACLFGLHQRVSDTSSDARSSHVVAVLRTNHQLTYRDFTCWANRYIRTDHHTSPYMRQAPGQIPSPISYPQVPSRNSCIALTAEQYERHNLGTCVHPSRCHGVLDGMLLIKATQGDKYQGAVEMIHPVTPELCACVQEDTRYHDTTVFTSVFVRCPPIHQQFRRAPDLLLLPCTRYGLFIVVP